MPGTLPDVSWAGCGCVMTVASGPPVTSDVLVPGVVGISQAAAETNIEAAGLVVGTITSASHATYPAGYVISQNPSAGTPVSPGSSVNFVISTGPASGAIPAPTGLTATPGNAQVSLSWNAVSGANQYTVKMSLASGGPYNAIAIPTGPSYTDTGLTNGTTYYYVVTANGPAGESANSSQVSATPAAGAATRTMVWGKSPETHLPSIGGLGETESKTQRNGNYLFPAAAGQNYLYMCIPVEFGGPTYPGGFMLGGMNASIAQPDDEAPFGTDQLNGYWFETGSSSGQDYRIYRASLTTAGAPTWTVN
jgi:hypothetical protein